MEALQHRATPAWRHDLAVALVGLVLILAWDLSGLDQALIRRFGSDAGFALRDHWLFSGVLHRGGYWISVALFTTVLLSSIGPWRSRSLEARTRACWLGSVGLALLLVPAFKQASLTSCPWSLAEFGGSAQYVSHWSFGIADGGPGHCFPSGHASGAFAFIGGWFAWRPRRPRTARAWLLGTLLLGTIFGLAQMARGAHYLSHALYTAWICWSVSALVFHAGGRIPAAPAKAPPAPVAGHPTR